MSKALEAAKAHADKIRDAIQDAQRAGYDVCIDREHVLGSTGVLVMGTKPKIHFCRHWRAANFLPKERQ